MPTPAEIPISEHLRTIPPAVRPTVQAARGSGGQQASESVSSAAVIHDVDARRVFT